MLNIIIINAEYGFRLLQMPRVVAHAAAGKTAHDKQTMGLCSLDVQKDFAEKQYCHKRRSTYNKLKIIE
ncbi:hypothetical protein IBX35_02605 [Candidatus Bathyarchaeota archaeon]|nr:hypothetical protein [Candidatus Bathyarchaeota archaeon]